MKGNSINISTDPVSSNEAYIKNLQNYQDKSSTKFINFMKAIYKILSTQEENKDAVDISVKFNDFNTNLSNFTISGYENYKNYRGYQMIQMYADSLLGCASIDLSQLNNIKLDQKLKYGTVMTQEEYESYFGTVGASGGGRKITKKNTSYNKKRRTLTRRNKGQRGGADAAVTSDNLQIYFNDDNTPQLTESGEQMLFGNYHYACSP